MSPLVAGRWLSVVVLLAATVLFHRFFRIVCVSGNSMLPTFHDGDWLLVAKRRPESPEPRRGELVIARSPTGYLVKRIVGLPGEAVEVIQGAVHINGHPHPTGAPNEHGCLQLSRGWLLPNRYALLGDHRDVTSDLAEHAVVGSEDLVGRVVVRLFPEPSPIPPPREPVVTLTGSGGTMRSNPHH